MKNVNNSLIPSEFIASFITICFSFFSNSIIIENGKGGIRLSSADFIHSFPSGFDPGPPQAQRSHQTGAVPLQQDVSLFKEHDRQQQPGAGLRGASGLFNSKRILSHLRAFAFLKWIRFYRTSKILHS